MNLEAFVHNYGYLAIAVGTFFEGETILILGGAAAQFGSLDLLPVMLAAFTGSAAGDQLYYFIGCWKGKALLDYFPRWHKSADRVSGYLERYQNLVILSFRFSYGLRNVTPFVLGITQIPISRFVLLNLLGAALWAASFASVGYVLGDAHERLLGRGYGFIVLAVDAVMFCQAACKAGLNIR